MATNIRKSDGTLITLQDSLVNRNYSVSLFGDDVENYTSPMAQTFFQLHEHFSASLPPNQNPYVNFINEDEISPQPVTSVTGQLWYDSFNEVLMIYNGNESSPNFGWKPVAEESDSISLVPLRDAEQDIGSIGRNWHYFYTTHMFLDTNRYLGQVNVSDPDNVKALNVDGNIVLRNTSTNITSINTVPGEIGFIGDENNPFQKIVTRTIRFGNGDKSGLRVLSTDESSIIPSSIDDDTTNEIIVHMGNEEINFTSIATNKLTVQNIQPVTGSNSFKIGTNTKIVANSKNSVDVGSETVKVKNIYTDELSLSKLSSNNGTFYANDTVAKTIYDRGYQVVPDGNIEVGDKVSVRKNNGTTELVELLTLFPVGAITMWGLSVEDIPYGWAVCDGATHGSVATPDLRDRFILSVLTDGEAGPSGTNNVLTLSEEKLGTVNTSADYEHDHGGTNPHRLTLDQIPEHSHSYTYNNSSRENGDEGYQLRDSSVTDTTSSVGGDGEHSHDIPLQNPHFHTVDLIDHAHTINLDDALSYKMIYIMKVA